MVDIRWSTTSSGSTGPLSLTPKYGFSRALTGGAGARRWIVIVDRICEGGSGRVCPRKVKG
jgi:hypothetical protein